MHPIDNDRLVYQEAQTAAVLLNVHRDPKARPTPISVPETVIFPTTPPAEPRPLTRAEEEERFRESFYARGLVVKKA